jgi:hypothetical protein
VPICLCHVLARTLSRFGGCLGVLSPPTLCSVKLDAVRKVDMKKSPKITFVGSGARGSGVAGRNMTDEDEPRRRPIEANLAQALCWGAPPWILDDGPRPAAPLDSDTCSPPPVKVQRLRSWFDQVRHHMPHQDALGDR